MKQYNFSKRKGIILAGGYGTRLKPLTIAVSKQLLPIYNKPMIYYPLSVLMLMKINRILIISDRENILLYKKLFVNSKQLGLNISYKIQNKPKGISEAFKLGKKFINNHPSVLILGDNIFYGTGFTNELKKANRDKISSIFTYKVSNPDSFGIFDKKTHKVVEKPKKYISNDAVVGIYFMDNKVTKKVHEIKPSERGELEITDLLNIYLKNKKIKIRNLGRGTAWLDTGTFEGMLNASNFVRTLEKRQGLQIANLEEIAINNKWVCKNKLKFLYSKNKSDYYNYIKNL
jgi:glucose-1-phosphate thymidylyltransferase